MSLIIKSPDLSLAENLGSNVMINFNGTTSYFTILDDFTDNFETYPNDITCVWWMKNNGGNVAQPILGIVQGTNDADGFRIEQIATGSQSYALRIRTGKDSGGTEQVFETTNNTIPPAGSVDCYMISTDRANAAISVYRNDTAITTTRTSTTNNDFDHGAGYLSVGRYAPNLSAVHFDGCMARIWIDQRTVDFSVTANRRKFINAVGQRIDYGTNGEIPFGSTPKIYLDGDSSTFTQLGTITFSAGNLTRSNLTDCSDVLP